MTVNKVILFFALVIFSMTYESLVIASAPVGTIGNNTPKDPTLTPAEIEGTGIDEKLGEKIDLDMDFVNEEGQTVRLREYFNNGRPLLVSFIYYNCPNLCNFHLNGMVESLSKFSWEAGKTYDYLVISIDPNEKSNLAKAKKANLLEAFSDKTEEKNWHFLVSPDDSVKKLATQMGFNYKWNDEIKEWAHGAAAFVLTEDGTLSRILYGIEFKEQTLKLALVEAGKGKIGSIMDRVVLYCYHYNPKDKKYSLAVFRVMQAGGGMIILFLLFLLGLYGNFYILPVIFIN